MFGATPYDSGAQDAALAMVLIPAMLLTEMVDCLRIHHDASGQHEELLAKIDAFMKTHPAKETQ
jgi:hypothetical protein